MLVLFVKKKDSSLYLCVKFCGLNCISKENCYPLLFISNLLDLPSKAQIYTKIDLHHAYHLVHTANSDKWKTTFRIHYRSFEQSIMPFSLTNTLITFQQFINSYFSNLLDICVMMYLDNILIYMNNMSRYCQHVKKVLKYLCKAGLYAKAKKCGFYSKSVEYLEYIPFFFWSHHV